ncbi:hypothetical protein AC579_7298 [Pseudocercospora musae]|uniref:Phosphatidylglycerol/phosphatidylinositol transfer protein n=1 Tax=Pseudocercospora musae TaxID=113226 RepID=A0A139I365_9PEZI|nr:hypothetical protein AC579_7298 [Pseudocercospora musae]
MAYNNRMTLSTLVTALLSLLLFSRNANAANQTANFLEMRNNNVTSWNSTLNLDLKKRSARHLIDGGTGFHYCYSPHYHNHKKFPTTIDSIKIGKHNDKLRKIWRGAEMGFTFTITPSEDIIEGTQLWPNFLPWVLDWTESPHTTVNGDAIDICGLVDCPVPANQQFEFTAKVKIPAKLRQTTRTKIHGTKMHFEFAVPTEDGDAGPYDVLTCAQHSVKVDDMRNPGLGCEWACGKPSS